MLKYSRKNKGLNKLQPICFKYKDINALMQIKVTNLSNKAATFEQDLHFTLICINSNL